MPSCYVRDTVNKKCAKLLLDKISSCVMSRHPVLSAVNGLHQQCTSTDCHSITTPTYLSLNKRQAAMTKVTSRPTDCPLFSGEV